MSVISSKIAIALVADIRNWAFHNIAGQIMKRLSGRYDFALYYYADYESLDDLCQELFSGGYDVVHCFWRDWVADFCYQTLKSRRDLLPSMLKTALTFSVYDHGFLSASDIRRKRVIFELADGYTVSSERLDGIYRGIAPGHPPDCVIADGVDLGLFYPQNLERLAETGRDIVVGWVGNSRWHYFEGVDHKGLYSIIRPAVEELRAEGLPVTGEYADRNKGHIPVERMVDYYNSIDIYVCASDIEGTPNPVLESMACGVPVVSTDVGIVPQLFGPKQSAFILKERSVACLKERLRELVIRPELRQELSRENLETIKGWTREQESVKWDAFFSRILERRAALDMSDEWLAERQRRLLQYRPESKPALLARRACEIVTRRLNIIKFNLKYGR